MLGFVSLEAKRDMPLQPFNKIVQVKIPHARKTLIVFIFPPSYLMTLKAQRQLDMLNDAKQHIILSSNTL